MSKYYSDKLKNKIRSVIRTKRCGVLMEGAIWLRDNVRTHTAQLTQDTLFCLDHFNGICVKNIFINQNVKNQMQK